MTVRERIERQDRIEINIDWARHWNALVDSLPDLLKSPWRMAELAMWVLNLGLQLAVFGVLMGQTVHVLAASEKRYINLRHLLIKWVLLVGAMELTSYVQQHTSQDILFALLCHSLLLLLVAPSKFIKNLHLKYFSVSERKKLDDSEEDPTTYEMPFTTRMLVSLTLFCLNASRLMITFVPLAHRKRIEEAMKGVNMVIVEEKYFWKLYESAWSNPAPPAPEPPTPTLNTRTSMLKNSTLLKPESIRRETVLRAKAAEYIQIVINTLSSVGGGRKFTYYRDVEVVYDVETSELTLISEEDNKSTEHVLSEIFMVDDSMIALVCEDEKESIYVKFKLKKDMDAFVHSISLAN